MNILATETAEKVSNKEVVNLNILFFKSNWFLYSNCDMPTQKDIIAPSYPHTTAFMKLKYVCFLFLLQTPFFTVEASVQFPYIMCGIYCGQSCNEESFPSFSIDKKSADI
jgi:hypothetical protein